METLRAESGQFFSGRIDTNCVMSLFRQTGAGYQTDVTPTILKPALQILRHAIIVVPEQAPA